MQKLRKELRLRACVAHPLHQLCVFPMLLAMGVSMSYLYNANWSMWPSILPRPLFQAHTAGQNSPRQLTHILLGRQVLPPQQVFQEKHLLEELQDKCRALEVLLQFFVLCPSCTSMHSSQVDRAKHTELLLSCQVLCD